jgi:NADH-quinone oxidoreductase subunit M
VAHGIITAMLFIMVGLLVERTGTHEISKLGGLARQMPLLAVGLGFAGFASLGLPSLAGFIAEFTVFLGAFQRYEWAVLMAIFGAVLSAGYILWMLQRVIFGPIRHDLDGLPDQRHWWEHSAVAGLAAIIVLLGVYPSVLTDMIGPAVSTIVTRVGS